MPPGIAIIMGLTILAVLALGLGVFFWWRIQYGVWRRTDAQRGSEGDGAVVLDAGSGWAAAETGGRPAGPGAAAAPSQGPPGVRPPPPEQPKAAPPHGP